MKDLWFLSLAQEKSEILTLENELLAGGSFQDMYFLHFFLLLPYEFMAHTWTGLWLLGVCLAVVMTAVEVLLHVLFGKLGKKERKLTTCYANRHFAVVD